MTSTPILSPDIARGILDSLQNHLQPDLGQPKESEELMAKQNDNDSPGTSAHPHESAEKGKITLEMMRERLTVPLLCDALDSAGYRHQSPRLPISPITLPDVTLIGRCKTSLWADMAHVDPEPYKLELAAVDSCRPDDVLVCAASGSMRSGIWGELLSTAAGNSGCIGVVVDGAVRDVAQMRRMKFPVFARGVCPYDSRDRQRVIDFDITIEIDGVTIQPGDLIAADQDGIVIVPQQVEADVVFSAWQKVHAENQVRDAIRAGMSATKAFETFGVL
jgi:4-hydroxy-4-methyl-2-oxoglutarate aldolase